MDVRQQYSNFLSMGVMSDDEVREKYLGISGSCLGISGSPVMYYSDETVYIPSELIREYHPSGSSLIYSDDPRYEELQKEYRNMMKSYPIIISQKPHLERLSSPKYIVCPWCKIRNHPKEFYCTACGGPLDE